MKIQKALIVQYTFFKNVFLIKISVKKREERRLEKNFIKKHEENFVRSKFFSFFFLVLKRISLLSNILIQFYKLYIMYSNNLPRGC